MREYYTIPEVAKIYKMKASTIRQWIRGGLLNAVKAGKQYRIRQCDMDEFDKFMSTKYGKDDFNDNLQTNT